MQNKQNVAVLLLSIGSPKSVKLRHIASYLSQFLSDGRIINLPKFLRFILVNLIIVPIRVFGAQKRYKQIWLKQGSPLVYYTACLRDKLSVKLGNDADVYMGMCFGSDSVNKVLREMEAKQYSKIILVSMFPQYASSSSGVVLERALNALQKQERLPEILTINSFYTNAMYVKTIADKILSYNPASYSKIIFTYHSVPKSHLPQGCRENTLGECKHTSENYCYLNDCYKTTELIAKQLNLEKGKYNTTFQSQLNRKWLAPFTDELVAQLAKKGESLLIVSPGFVTDCLETTMELGVEYKELYYRNAGTKYTLVSGLNCDDTWVEALQSIVKLVS